MYTKIKSWAGGGEGVMEFRTNFWDRKQWTDSLIKNKKNPLNKKKEQVLYTQSLENVAFEAFFP